MATAAEIREQIAGEVRAELARQRVTQRDLAESLDMVQPALQLRLSGQRSFRAEEIVLIAESLNVPAAQFFCVPAVAA